LALLGQPPTLPASATFLVTPIMVSLRRIVELMGLCSQARFPAVTDRVIQYNCYFADTDFGQPFAIGRISINSVRILDL
jgi:hypothetical protein